jgi:hypothetical protein
MAIDIINRLLNTIWATKNHVIISSLRLVDSYYVALDGDESGQWTRDVLDVLVSKWDGHTILVVSVKPGLCEIH